MTPYLLAACTGGSPEPTAESHRRPLAVAPASEVATWQKAGTSDNPEGRYLQAVAFDEKREVVMMFGGETPASFDEKPICNQELWEWSLATGKWSRRIGTSSPPSARAGAALAYDATNDRFVLFGGRTSDGADLADTWEWDPTSGAWTDRTGSGTHPPARTQHGMVFQKSTGKLVLFGGGTSDATAVDGTRISVSMKDTWEYDPTAHTWSERSPATAPGARHDFGLVWDATKNRAFLFGGQQLTQAGATPVPKQDVWEWDPAGAGTWTERTAEGVKPSPRFGHAMSYEASRKKVLVFGGWNIDSSYAKNDLWEWDPTAYTWTQRLSGSEAGVPTQRMYASLIDNAKGRLVLVGGAVEASGSVGVFVAGKFYAAGSNEVWDLDPATVAFKDRTTLVSLPSPRSGHLMAYNPSTRRTYLFGGYDSVSSNGPLNDLWEWDGTTWTEVVTELSPPAVVGPAMAYDPVRKSLILYGGNKQGAIYAESTTWEWGGSTRQWSRLAPATSPGPASGHAMVTDTTRGKILLFGSVDDKVWEWDGAQQTWTSRTQVSLQTAPEAFYASLLAYDEGRRRVFLLYQGDKASRISASSSAFWEWNPESAGWQLRDPGDQLEYSSDYVSAAYDSIRRRLVLFTGDFAGNTTTYELDGQTSTWYERAPASMPRARSRTGMAFDSDRGVVVLFGGVVQNPIAINDTWEYKVTNLVNGAGCSANLATVCASSNCVDGVCCEAAACTGACKACNVPGSEGTCKLVAAGTEVAGSCEAGKACDGAGTCKSKNGQPCTGNDACAAGFCVDGLCCDSACAGACVSCSLTGREGRCAPQPAGTDPKNECTVGTGVCKSTCDGVGACGFPAETVYCDACNRCDGRGQCSVPDPYCNGAGGGGGATVPPKGGAGGATVAPKGGAGGTPSSTADASGGSGGAGHSGGAGGGAGSNAGAGGKAGAAGGAGSGGGSGGAGGGAGGSAGVSGSGGQAGSARDAGPIGQGDAAFTAKIQRGGCSCALARDSAPPSGWFLPFMLAGAGLWLGRRRRRGEAMAVQILPSSPDQSRKQGAR